MAVLMGGMSVLKTNFKGTQHGVFTKRPEALTSLANYVRESGLLNFRWP